MHKGQNSPHKQSEKASMCFKTRRASTRDYTVSLFIKSNVLKWIKIDKTTHRIVVQSRENRKKLFDYG